jgi:hypothetical protein
MEQEVQKATLFVQRLLSNPALQKLSIVQREHQIMQFLRGNEKQLYPTLSSPDFFPGHPWKQILGRLAEELGGIINKSLLTQLKSLVERMDFSFLAFLQEQPVPIPNAAEILLEFEEKILGNPAAKKSFAGPFHAVLYGATDRYVEEAYRRRQYIHFELAKVQRLKMGKEEVKNMVKASLLLKNGIHLLSVEPDGRSQQTVQAAFGAKAYQAMQKQIGVLPEPLLRSGINANVSFLDDTSIETTARLAAIFAVRCQNYMPLQKVDRGADSPDKSWFSIARRNFKYYGFDIKMLDELYKTAGENGW